MRSCDCNELQQFLDLCALTNTVAEVVQLSASDLTVTDNFYLVYVRAVKREGLFYADTVGNTSYGKGFGNAAAALSDNGTFVNLNTFAVAFLDSVVNLNGVTDLKNRSVLLELLAR